MQAQEMNKINKNCTIYQIQQVTMTSKPSARNTSERVSSSGKHRSYVYVRVRPLMSPAPDSNSNSSDKNNLLKDLVTETTCFENQHDSETRIQVHHAMKGNLPISGFHGIFGLETKNEFVFQKSFLPRIENTIMRSGGTASFFCYGYTGAGKTHTTLGYDKEKGVFQYAAQELLKSVTGWNSLHANKECDLDSDAVEEPLIILASVMEVYNDEVYDLLANEKVKCTLRKNKQGQLLVRGATTKHSFTESEQKAHGLEDGFNIITQTLSSIPLNSLDDLLSIQRKASLHRKVGTSTQHDQSSRSHAIFRLDICNQSLLTKLNDLEKLEQIKPCLQTVYDKKRTYKLRHKVMDVEKQIDVLSQSIDSLYEKLVNTPFGGRLILVDLAGADTDNRSIGLAETTKEQRKESTAINQSLMALKDCIRGLSSQSQQKQQQGTNNTTIKKRSSTTTTKSVIPFRNSSLTRLLEEVLTPRVGENRDSESVMIVNVGPENDLKQKTINTLRYGSMFASTTSTTKAKTQRKQRESRGSSSSFSQSSSNSLREAKLRMKREMMAQKKVTNMDCF